MRTLIVLGLLALLTAASAFSQVQADAEFEVASVRENTLNDRIVSINVGPGSRFAAKGYTLVLLMQRAYGVMDWNVTGGPGWIRTDRWDVVAKSSFEGNLTEQQLQPMLQRLLADRFKLMVHESSRQMPGWALVVDRGGPRVKASAEAEESRDAFRMTGTEITAQGITMATFARFVTGKLGLVGVDETGLPGLYDFKIQWAVQKDPTAPVLDDPLEALRFAVNTALRDQLGLKLMAKRINVRTIVIDGVEKASEN
jgi:uncharacterized protein (TIGR03435 family)